MTLSEKVSPSISKVPFFKSCLHKKLSIVNKKLCTMGDMTIHPVLLPYVGVSDLLVRTFADCEVVLHDLTVPQRSVVYVANPVVTGRKVGESFERLPTFTLKIHCIHINHNLVKERCVFS